MRRAAKWAGLVLGSLLLLLAALIAVVVGGSATQPGRAMIARLVPSVTGGTVHVAGLSGWLFGASRIAQVKVSDREGTWLTIEGLALDWRPQALFAGQVAIRLVAADRVVVARRPVSSGSSTTVELPLRIDLAALRIERLDLAAEVAGQAVSLAVDGTARLDAIDRGAGRLALRRLDGQGTYTADLQLEPAGIHATLHLAEPAGGLIGSLAALPAIGAISADATLAGPLTAIAVDAALTAGQLRARVTGQVDAPGRSANLTVVAEAPAMAPRPDLSWQAISLKGNVQGSFTKPDVSATLVAEGVSLGEAGLRRLTADVQGNAGRLTLQGQAVDIRLPGPQPDALAAAPLLITADMRLDTADRGLTFDLRHPLFDIAGTAATAGHLHGEVHLTVPEIAPLAAAGGVGVAGHLGLTLRAAVQGEDIDLSALGDVGVSSGSGVVSALLGESTKLDVLATLHGQAIRLARLDVASGAFSAGMSGTVAPGTLDLDWHVAVNDLATLSPTVNGPFEVSGKARGTADDVTLTADLAGEVGGAGIAPGKVTAQVALTGLPNAPNGRISAHGMLLGAPLELAIAAARENGRVRVAIERADWKSAHAKGTLQVDPATLVPQGQISFAMTQLGELQPLLGEALAGRALRGSVSGKLDGTEAGTTLTITAINSGLPGTATVGRAVLDAKVSNPIAHPVLDGRLALDGVVVSGMTGSAQIEAKGPTDALSVRVAATLPAVADAPAKLAAAGTIDATARIATIASLQADWKQAAIRLLGPARVGFADGVTVQGVRIGLRQAVLEAGGRISPTLDLTARLRGAPASLASLADPSLAMDGTLEAEATLTGTPARPGGTIRVTARGLRSSSGPARALPAADLTATAVLQGTAAQVDLRLRAGTTQVTVSGTAPLTPDGALNLRAAGAADLAMTDPVLTPGGQRARGRVSVDATITGTSAAPRVNGGMQLIDGSFRDFPRGIDIEAINAGVAADGGALRLTRFAAKAGAGTIDASGSLDLAAPGRPLDLTLTVHDARPLANDLLTANIDADLTLRGTLAGSLTAAGRVFVRRADIRVPDRLPVSVPTLNVRVAGASPPAPVAGPGAAPVAAHGPNIALDLTIDAPQQVFIRGRGLNAEMGGSVHVQGSAANPIPSGSFALRRGDFSMAGQTLTFSSGQIGFDGGSLTDPSLNFAATTTAGDVTATLAITGTASKPKFTLSSTPTLPQDEVLAYLLYGARTASLGPLEIAQIAATLASLAGVAPTMSNPLESVRAAMGLDRLTIGSGSSLEAGRYVARDVYVGAKQSVTGTGTQAVVQVDLAKGLKLQATAGTSSNQSATGSNGSADAASVGITYEFEY